VVVSSATLRKKMEKVGFIDQDCKRGVHGQGSPS
jgi:hypothetical protein